MLVGLPIIWVRHKNPKFKPSARIAVVVVALVGVGFLMGGGGLLWWGREICPVIPGSIVWVADDVATPGSPNWTAVWAKCSTQSKRVILMLKLSS